MLDEKKLRDIISSKKLYLIGSHIKIFNEVVSTNDVVYEFAIRGADEGLLVVADYQTAGKGRLGRSWFAKEGTAVLFSTFVYGRTLNDKTLALTPVASIATCEAIKSVSGLNVNIVWPNDVVYRLKKLAGVLVECKNTPNNKRIFIIGIGINVNMRSEDFPNDLKNTATSLFIETKKEISREHLIAELISQIDELYNTLSIGNIDIINQLWRNYSEVMNKNVLICENNQIFSGRVVDVDVLKGLYIELDKGGIRNFRGEFIEWMRLKM